MNPPVGLGKEFGVGIERVIDIGQIYIPFCRRMQDDLSLTGFNRSPKVASS
jgi:hypothetical protein